MVPEKLEKKNEVLYAKLVPGSGHADTLEGEMLRAINKIVYRYYNDGDYYHEGYGIETAAPAHAFLLNLDYSDGYDRNNKDLLELERALFKILDSDNTLYGKDYEDSLNDALIKILDYIESREKSGYKINKYDMLDSTPLFEDDEDDEEFTYDYDDEYYAKGGRLNQEQKIYLKDLFYNVRDKEDNRIKKTFNKLDELGVSFRTQNEVIALAEESRTKNLNADDVTKLLSKYAKGGKTTGGGLKEEDNSESNLKKELKSGKITQNQFSLRSKARESGVPTYSHLYEMKKTLAKGGEISLNKKVKSYIDTLGKEDLISMRNELGREIDKGILDKSKYKDELAYLNNKIGKYMYSNSKSGDLKAKHTLHIDGQNWFLEKIDSTHFYMSNDKDFRGMAHHIGQHRGEPYYEEVRQWLKDTYAKGGEVMDIKVYESPLSNNVIATFNNKKDLYKWNKKNNVFADSVSINGISFRGWDEIEEYDGSYDSINYAKGGEVGQGYKRQFYIRPHLKPNNSKEILYHIYDWRNDKVYGLGAMGFESESKAKKYIHQELQDQTYFAKGGEVKVKKSFKKYYDEKVPVYTIDVGVLNLGNNHREDHFLMALNESNFIDDLDDKINSMDYRGDLIFKYKDKYGNSYSSDYAVSEFYLNDDFAKGGKAAKGKKLLTKEYKDYLDKLRDSGRTNMFGATPYLEEEFGLSYKDAKQVLVEWMRSFAKGGNVNREWAISKEGFEALQNNFLESREKYNKKIQEAPFMEHSQYDVGQRDAYEKAEFRLWKTAHLEKREDRNFTYAKGGKVDYNEIKKEILEERGFTEEDFHKGAMSTTEAKEIMKLANKKYSELAKPSMEDLGRMKYNKGGEAAKGGKALNRENLNKALQNEGIRDEIYNDVIQNYSYIGDLNIDGDDVQKIIEDMVDMQIEILFWQNDEKLARYAD